MLPTISKLSLIPIAIAISLVQMPKSIAGMPSIVDAKPPTIAPSVNPNPAPAQPSSQTVPDRSSIATASILRVGCDGLQTIVQKGERQAFLFNWKTSHFGGEYTPAKRCEIVSDRLQSAADRNGGTLKGLELGSGKLNGQTVICVLQQGEKGCTKRNLLFTLNPDNAKRPQAVIAKILTFATNGSTTVDESAGIPAQVSPNLGSWEEKTFPEPKKATPDPQERNRGF